MVSQNRERVRRSSKTIVKFVSENEKEMGMHLHMYSVQGYEHLKYEVRNNIDTYFSVWKRKRCTTCTVICTYQTTQHHTIPNIHISVWVDFQSLRESILGIIVYNTRTQVTVDWFMYSVHFSQYTIYMHSIARRSAVVLKGLSRVCDEIGLLILFCLCPFIYHIQYSTVIL